MIQQKSQSISVVEEDGQETFIDLETVEGVLEQALEDLNVPDYWIAEHVVSALKEYWEDANADQRASFTVEDVDLVIMKMLVDAAYPDVARRFSELRGVNSAKLSESETTAWDKKRVTTVLQNRLALAPSAATELGKKVEECLKLLGFTHVTDALITELGSHVLEKNARAYREEQTDKAWLMSPGYWETFFPEYIGEWVQEGILTIHPFSDLFPLRWLTLDLAALARKQANTGLLTELAFIPEVRTSCQRAAEVVDVLLQYPGSAAQGEEDSTRFQVHLIIRGMDAAVTDYLQASQKQEKERISNELKQIFDEGLETYLGQHLVMSIQS